MKNAKLIRKNQKKEVAYRQLIRAAVSSLSTIHVQLNKVSSFVLHCAL